MVIAFAVLAITALMAFSPADLYAQPTPLPLPTFSKLDTAYGGSSSNDLYVFRPSPDRTRASLDIWYVRTDGSGIVHATYSLTEKSALGNMSRYDVIWHDKARTCSPLVASFVGAGEALDIRNGSRWVLRLGRINDDMIRNSLANLRFDAQLEAKTYRHAERWERLPLC